VYDIVKWALTRLWKSGINGCMTAQMKKNKRVKEYKSVSLVGKNRSKISQKDPVVNKVSFRDIFGVVSKFVQVGGDFV
jgi:hypothetical protein